MHDWVQVTICRRKVTIRVSVDENNFEDRSEIMEQMIMAKEREEFLAKKMIGV